MVITSPLPSPTGHIFIILDRNELIALNSILDHKSALALGKRHETIFELPSAIEHEYRPSFDIELAIPTKAQNDFVRTRPEAVSILINVILAAQGTYRRPFATPGHQDYG